ncbi:Coronin-1A, putative [Perkinsus marinus ATCC 50983]|uniref:Coronin-1A, putative n=1 Tax=Perkinsus marinus (strain ATCC 50983 / TXsc) TaxID=423536 RepID=C5KTV2_PERM5|nr:Coronin-1A, putative [Perkinsus marinus ATCC 50983]EER11994.1 Coronin-1A, putative [Perkinsus marinus ATCC 50983]|eukprot:XP_002780199.1 Coronin-1A, putative [Perkinsus marinus ATCC 50983]
MTTIKPEIIIEGGAVASIPSSSESGIVQKPKHAQLQAIFQYLMEHEYLEAFSVLQRESGVAYTEGSSDCSVLDRAVDMWYSAQYAAYGDSEESEGGPEDLLEGIVKEAGVTPHAVVRSATAPHGARANPTCVVFHPTDSTLLATGGADREVKLWRDSEAVIEPTGLAFHAPSPVLSLDWSPDGAFIAVGCMGGEVVVFDATTGEQVGKSSHPTKTHVLRCQFCPRVKGDGELLLFSACRDMTVQFYERTRIEGSRDFEWRKTGLLRQAQPVSAATWLDCDEPVLVMAIENDPYMHYYSGETLKNIGDYSLNPHKLDRHVSFRIRDMYYGIDIDEYDNPSLAVSADRSFVLSTTTDKSGSYIGGLAVFETFSQQKVMTIPVHERGAIRHMCFSKTDDKIASVSFEKSLKIIE